MENPRLSNSTLSSSYREYHRESIDSQANLALLETLPTNHKSMISITKETIQESRDFASREDANGRPISATRKHNSANVNSVKLAALERYEQRIQGAVEFYKVRVAALEKTEEAK